MGTAEKVNRFFDELTVPRACYIIALASLVSCAAAIAVGNKYLTPVLNLAAIVPFYIWATGRGRYGTAVGITLLWTACLSAFLTVGTMFFPERAVGAVLHGEAFNADISGWITGANPGWGETGAYALTVVSQSGLAAGLSILTGGIAGLAVAAANANYVSANAGLFLLGSTDVTTSTFFVWPFWEVLKLLGITNLTVGFGGPVTRFLLRRTVNGNRPLDFIIAGLLFCGLSIFVQWQLGLFWRDVLADVTIMG